MRSIPTTKSTTTSSLSLSPSPSTSTAPSSSTSSDMNSTTWHSPIPYLFGGLAAMLGLIAFALLILACSYWKLSVQRDDEEAANNNNNRDMEGKEHGDSSKKGTVKVYEEKILVIMAGDEIPTFLATPTCAKCSFFADDGVSNSNHSDKDIKNHDKTLAKSEKEMNNNNHLVLQDTTLLSNQQPHPQETTQQEN